MALVQITENTLRAFLADAEITAFDSAGAEGDYPERAGALIRTTCNLVAGIVNSSGKYPILATGQDRVPEELEHPTLVWIRHAMLADLPDMGDLEGSPRQAVQHGKRDFPGRPGGQVLSCPLRFGEWRRRGVRSRAALSELV